MGRYISKMIHFWSFWQIIDFLGPFYLRVKKVCLEPYDGCDDEIGIDGEAGPKTPFTIKVVPQAIPIISV